MKKAKLKRLVSYSERRHSAAMIVQNGLLHQLDRATQREAEATAVYAEAVVVWGEKERELKEMVAALTAAVKLLTAEVEHLKWLADDAV